MSNKLKINGKVYPLEFNIRTIRKFGVSENIKSFSKTGEALGKAFETIDEFASADKVAKFVSLAIDDESITPEVVVDLLYDAEFMKTVADAFTDAFVNDEAVGKPTRAQRRKTKK